MITINSAEEDAIQQLSARFGDTIPLRQTALTVFTALKQRMITSGMFRKQAPLYTWLFYATIEITPELISKDPEDVTDVIDQVVKELRFSGATHFRVQYERGGPFVNLYRRRFFGLAGKEVLLRSISLNRIFQRAAVLTSPEPDKEERIRQLVTKQVRGMAQIHHGLRNEEWAEEIADEFCKLPTRSLSEEAMARWVKKVMSEILLNGYLTVSVRVEVVAYYNYYIVDFYRTVPQWQSWLTGKKYQLVRSENSDSFWG